MGQDRNSLSGHDLDALEKANEPEGGYFPDAGDLRNTIQDLRETIRVKDQVNGALRRESAVTFQRDVNAWQDKTFPHATPQSILAHVRRELAELEDDPSDPAEAADIYILLLALAGKVGYDLHNVAAAKMDENYTRTWGKPDAEGVVEHVR
jgi:hypothetical protein